MNAINAMNRHKKKPSWATGPGGFGSFRENLLEEALEDPRAPTGILRRGNTNEDP